VLRRARTIHNKAKENFEERGLETLALACGLATWENKRAAWEPCAPVLLRQAVLRPLGAAQDEFELSLVDEMEVNATLLHLLKVDFDCDLDQETLLDRIDGVIDEPWELEAAYEWMKEHTRRVPGFDVQLRLVLANFAYAKLPMVKDLESAFDELVAHELIAAIAGDEEAREKVRSAGPGPDAVPHPDHIPLADEFLVLDADSSQNYAVNAILAGESLIVRGPPGTGKSQTISNLIAALVARGKKVLFVAEKRAAIDAVLKRLRAQTLGDLVLDLHGGVGSRRAFAQTIGRALVAHRTAPKVDQSAGQKKVEKRRDELNSYVRALHEKRPPWGISVYDVRAELQGILQSAQTAVRLRGYVLERLDGEAARQVEEDLAEYARFGGLTLASSGSPWSNAEIVSNEEVQAVFGLVDRLRTHTLPTALAVLSPVSDETRLPPSESLAGWETRLRLWGEVHDTLGFFQPAVFERDLEQLCERLAPAGDGGFSRMRASLLSGEYKAARNELRPLVVQTGKVSDGELLRRAAAAHVQLRRWRELGGQTFPAAPQDPAALRAPYEELLQGLEQLASTTCLDNLTSGVFEDVAALLERLAADRATLVKLPELHRLKTSLVAAGLGEFLDEMEARQVSEEVCIQSFRYAWLHSILDHISLSDLLVGGFVSEKHEKVVADFKAGDREHIETSAARIRRVCAEQATRARDEWRDQAQLVQHQAGLKRRHMPVRDLVRNAADVLLALKPCWAMSPLVVSQLLPATTHFDVVIFDEASQVTPADAVSSILRGTQLVVAGDERQLPPTAFFVSEAPEDEEESEEPEALPLVAGTKGFESILDALGSLLRFRMLGWHYRSRDERLIAFSNAHIYDRMLTTFPGIGDDDVLRHTLVPWQPGSDTNSPSPEVEAVVELILEHARTRPKESLGVIAMGIKHANRIEEALRQRLHDDPDLEAEVGEFFDEKREERFFVKNLERVQGDERDAIILSIGYGKNERGQLVYRFGPLLTEGGERRLNVAVTRAKKRLTLVTSFSSKDMDPERSTAEGVKLLRQYLQYVESGGTNLGDRVLDKPALNPFEVDVRDTLSRRGLKLTPQYGSSGYWIDFAVQHPTQHGRHVLAIECDGATYHSSESARDRDRLRQEQLERLGWRFHRIWSSEWFYDKEKAAEKVLTAYEEAARDVDRENDDDPPAVGRVPSSENAGEETLALLEEAFEPEPRSRRVGSSAPEPKRRRNGPRPPVRRGLPIHEYSKSQLIQLIRWIESDDILRTEDELLADAMRELGFERRGKNIVQAFRAAIKQARR
jgi:very-short-patch-repair endonuclease